MTRECIWDAAELSRWEIFFNVIQNFQSNGSESEKARFLWYFLPAWRKCWKMQIFRTREEFLLNFHYAECCKIEIYVKTVEVCLSGKPPLIHSTWTNNCNFYIKQNEVFLFMKKSNHNFKWVSWNFSSFFCWTKIGESFALKWIKKVASSIHRRSNQWN